MTSAADDSPTHLLTIHACHGRFLVWDEEVCRRLALDWRMIGERTSSKAAQLHPPGGVDESRRKESKSDESNESDLVPIQGLPMILLPYQVLFLYHHARDQLDLIDGSSVESLRRSSGHSKDELRDLIIRHKLQAFQTTLEQQAATQAALAQKYQHLKKAKGKRSHEEARNEGSKPEEKQQQQVENNVEPSTKKQKLTDSSVTTDSTEPVSSTANSTSTPSTLDATVASIVSSPSSLLPITSSFHIASTAFPLTQAVIDQHVPGHPTYITAQVIYPMDTPPLRLPRTIVALELQTHLTQIKGDVGRSVKCRMNQEDMERMIYQTIYVSLGLKSEANNSAAGVPPSSPVISSDVRSASSAAFDSFLRTYLTFTRLWEDGFYLLPGLHFGCDLMCYEDLPSQVHSTFMVKILPLLPSTATTEDKKANQLSTLETNNLSRMATSINKVVLVVQPILSTTTSPDAADSSNSSSLSSTHPSTIGSVTSSHNWSNLDQFRALIKDYSISCQFELSTFQWSLATGVQHGSYPGDHLNQSFIRKNNVKAAAEVMDEEI